MSVTYYAADYAYGINPQVDPAIVQSGSNAAGVSGTYVIKGWQTATSFGREFTTFNTNAPINLLDAAPDSAVVVSATSIDYVTNNINVTVTTPTHAHGKGLLIASGTAGLQECINDLQTRTPTGGVIVIDGTWANFGGTTAMITSAVNGANIVISDQRGSTGVQYYAWNGSAFAVVSGTFASGANGQSFVPFHNTELMTLSTSGLTTDSTANLLPALSVILMVTGYVQTTITTTTSWGLGDATTANRFTATDSTLTAGETVPKTAIPPVMIGTGVASATTGMWQLAAAKLRITCVGSNPGAGKVRVDVYGYTVTMPTS